MKHQLVSWVCLWLAVTTWSCDDTDEQTDIAGDDASEVFDQQEGDTDTGCPSELTECDGVCTSLLRDSGNCGTCGEVCPLGEACVSGACAIGCPDGQVVCGGTCVDPRTDRAHCGAGEDCDTEPGAACGDGEVCTAGECVLSCQPGLVVCDGVCTNTNTNRAHCGGCDDGSGARICSPGELCVGGECRLSCSDGWTNCEGQCVDVSSDRRYCSAEPGVCGASCAGDLVCSEGECRPYCAGSTTLCGDACTSTQRDPLNCGGCGNVPEVGDHVCGQTQSSFSYCESGSCHEIVCAAGWGNCDGHSATGCETDLTTDVNCGVCGASPNTMTDEESCGGCGNPCLPEQLCVEGVCKSPGDEIVLEVSIGEEDLSSVGVVIPPGTFTMGSPEDEPGRSNNEEQHEVVLTRPFVMGQTETTRGEVRGAWWWSGSSCVTDDCPVNRLSRTDVVQMLNEMSTWYGFQPCYLSTYYVDLDCEGFRLPTEAEWEYAYRAGTTTALYNGAIDSNECTGSPASAVGWTGCPPGQLREVGELAPNAWNLYDMTGNVSEMVWDRYSYYGGAVVDPMVPPSLHLTGVSRGGSHGDVPLDCRAAARGTFSDSYLGDAHMGVRWVRTLP